MIGAVVGVQPFSDIVLSSTGSMARGPDYFRRFTLKQTVTTNTAAIGDNARLQSLRSCKILTPVRL